MKTPIKKAPAPPKKKEAVANPYEDIQGPIKGTPYTKEDLLYRHEVMQRLLKTMSPTKARKFLDDYWPKIKESPGRHKWGVGISEKDWS